MLVLSRKLGEEVQIGDATVQIMRCGNNGVRLGIKAPDSVRILRRELIEAAFDVTTGRPAVAAGEEGNDHAKSDLAHNESRKADGPLAAELAAAKTASRRAG